MKNKFKDKFEIMLFGAALIIIGGIISIYIQTKAGSLTPPGSPGGTMYSLSDIAGSGFSTNSDSLKQIKSAILSGGKGSSLGSDMLTNYFDNQGLFTAHSNNCDGTESFVEIKSGSGLGYCIEKEERSSAIWILQNTPVPVRENVSPNLLSGHSLVIVPAPSAFPI